MSWKGHFKNALFALALIGFNAPQAEAIEIFTGASPASHLDDGLFTQVRGGRGGGGGCATAAAIAAACATRAACTAAGACTAAAHMLARAAGAHMAARIAAEPMRRERQPQCEPQRQPERQPQRQPGGLRLSWRLRLSRRRGLGGTSRLVPLAGWRRHRGRRGDRLRHGGDRDGLGRLAALSRALLVLHRRQPSTGLLGQLPEP